MPISVTCTAQCADVFVQLPETGDTGSQCDFLGIAGAEVAALAGAGAALYEVNSTASVFTLPWTWEHAMQSAPLQLIPRTSSSEFVLIDVRAASGKFVGTANAGRLELTGGPLVATLTTEVLQHDSISVMFHTCPSGSCGAPVPCEHASIAFKTVHCVAPPGSGRRYVQVSVNGGYFSSNRLPVDYVAITLDGVSPSVALLASAPSTQRLAFNITGGKLGEPAAAAPYSATVAGAPCGTLTIVSQTLVQCGDVDPSAFQVPRAPGQTTVSAPVCLYASNDTLCLDFALQVYTDMVIVSANVTSVPIGGAWVSLAVSGIGRNPRAEGFDFLPAAGDITSATLGTDRTSPVSCSDVAVTSSGTFRCRVPAGIGVLSPVRVERRGGITATGTLPLAYDGPVVTALQPPFAFTTSTAVSGRVDVYGRNFGAATADSLFQVSLGGVACGAVRFVNSGHVACIGLPLQMLDVDALSVQLSLMGRDAAVFSTAQFEVVPPPEVVSVLPAQVSVSGGETIGLFGNGFAPSTQPNNASFVTSVLVGQAPCSQIVMDSPKRLTCVVPDAASASGNAGGALSGNASELIVDVLLRMSNGETARAAEAITYVLPNIILVKGAELMSAPPGSNASQTIAFSGNELVYAGSPPTRMESVVTVPAGDSIVGPSGLPPHLCTAAFSAGATGAGVVCTFQCSPGALQSDSTTNAGRVSCLDFQLAQLAAALAPGASVTGNLQLTLASGVNVSSDPGTARFQGPPLVTAVVPASAAENESVTVQGACFGYERNDIQAVFVGGVRLLPAQWAWTGPEAITITQLPAPRSESAEDSQDVTIRVVTRTGLAAELPPERGFSWLLPPRPPVTAPQHVCSYRDESGAAHIMGLWPADGDVVTKVSPVKAWAVLSLALADGAHAPVTLTSTTADVQLTYVQVIAADSSTVRNVSQLQDIARVSCPHTVNRHVPGQHSLVDVTVRTVPSGDSAPPLILAMSANTDAADALMNGPFSAATPVLFARCQSAVGAEEQYLATQGVPGLQWTDAVCRACPEGAQCRGLPKQAVTNLPGWQRAEWDPLGLIFVTCANPDSCPTEAAGPVDDSVRNALNVVNGSRLHPVPSAYVDPAGQWEAFGGDGQGQPTATLAAKPCLEGHAGHLCGRCAPDYARSADFTCRKCASPGLQWLSLLGGLLLGGGLLTYLIRTTLRSAGDDLKPFVALNKLMFSHLQQIAIAASFPMKWPASLLSMFSVFNTSASISSDLISVDCFQWSDSAFTAGSITQLLLPVFVFLVLLAYWVGLRPMCGSVCRCDRSQCTVAACKASTSAAWQARACSFRCNKVHWPVAWHLHPAGTGPSARRKPSVDSDSAPAGAPAMPAVDSLPKCLTSANPLARPPTPKGREQQASVLGPRLSRSVSRSGRRARGVSFAASGQAKQTDKQPAGTTAGTAHTGVVTGMVVSVLVSCFVLHLSLSKTSLSLLTCVELAPGHPYLLGDLNIQCGSARGKALAVLGSIALIVYGFGIPLGSFTVLWRRRARLGETRVKAKYGFLYNQYKRDTWYWETVTLLRKVVLALIAVLLATQGTGVQVTASIILLVGCLVAHLLYLPHKLALLNTVEAASLTVAVVTLAGGAILVDDEAPTAWKTATTIFIVAMNALFLAGIVWCLFRSAAKSERIQERLQQLKRTASEKRLSFKRSSFAASFRRSNQKGATPARQPASSAGTGAQDSKTAPHQAAGVLKDKFVPARQHPRMNRK